MSVAALGAFAGNRELVLGVANALLELPAVGVRLAGLDPLQLGLRRLELLLRAIRVEPAFSIATSGACRASTPISPASPGTTIISTSPSKAAPSGVTSDSSKVAIYAGTGSASSASAFASAA